MEVFNSLMSVYLILVGVNLVLIFALWNSTGSKYFLPLIFHWLFLILSYVVHQEVIGSKPLTVALIVLVPSYLLHISLITAFRNMIGIPISIKKSLLAPLITVSLIGILSLFKVTSIILLFPMIIVHSFLYFYAAYESFIFKKSAMTFTQKTISIVFILIGIHLYDYIYFISQPSLLGYGFAIALAFEMTVSVLFPTAIIEKMTIDHERLKNEVEFLAKISYSSKMASLGEMAGGVAHELNNPLTILILYLKKLKSSVEVDSKANQLVDKCVQTTERMNRIIKGMLAFSREDLSSQFTQVVAEKMVNETLDLCAEKMKIHQIDLSVEMPERMVNFIGNGTQLSQVLLNLLNNSYDAIRNLEEKWIKVTVKDLGDKVEFAVTDSGHGLPPSIVEKMFNPFFTTKDTGMGTGLGLSVSKGILENHKGKLYLDTTSPNTRIVFVVPKFQFVKKQVAS
jgi:signal transduction histidine kinase